MTKYRDISVVIPAFNEEQNIARIVQDTIDALKSWTEKYEIIIVDDGSTDNTYSLARDLEAKGLIKLLRHEKNMGSGRAILTGFSAAGCNLVTYIGADGQFAPRELIRFFPAIDNSDIVVAFRSSRCDYSAYRLFNSFVYLYLIYILFSLKIKDINWVHLYKREAIKGIKINSSGVFMLGEMLIKAKEKGFKIAEVETSYFPRRAGKAKCSKPAVALKAFSEIFRLWFRMKLGIDRNE